jgi:formate dehydrogenase iron-sulfur subunit
MVACPFNIPRYEWNKPVPAVRKCDMCYERQQRGEKPACAEACPHKATVYGTRAELLAEAHRRIKASPKDYYPHVYGEHELGGTSVLFLAPFAMASLGYKAGLGKEPLPKLTWDVLSKLPGVGIISAGTLMAIWWITHRRDEVARFEAAEAAAGRNGRNGRRE